MNSKSVVGDVVIYRYSKTKDILEILLNLLLNEVQKYIKPEWNIIDHFIRHP